jgi:hypothetical protein
MESRRRVTLMCSLLAAIAGVAAGCSSKVATVTLFSTRNVEMSAPHDRLERTTETDSRLWLLFLPLGGAPSGLEAAVRLIEEKDADYLTNLDVTEGGWTLLAISRGWVEVEADPWRRSVGAKPVTPMQKSPVETEDY